MGFAELLGVCPGVTAVIGGGGKTTLLRTLGAELSPAHSVLLCTTTKIRPYPDLPWAGTLSELEVLRREHALLCAGAPIPGTGKLTALPVPISALAARFEYVLVEADGAAGRPLKAHGPHEPVIPPLANQVVCVVGALGFGRPIVQAAHRPERFAALAGVCPEDLVTPEILAAVLAAEGLHDKVYVNQVETEAALSAARRLAAMLPEPVAAGALQKGAFWRC